MQETVPVITSPGLTWERFSRSGKKLSNNLDWALRVVTTESDFDALEHDWNALVERSSCSVFQTFVWARTWWKYFSSKAKHSRLHIIVLSKNGDVAAIAPFFSDVTSVLGFARATRLSFLGRKISDYLDIIVRDGMHNEVYPRLAVHLSKNRTMWDLLFLEDIPDHSLTHTMLQTELTVRGMKGGSEITEQCPRITLPATWEEYYEKQSKKFQRELRRRQKGIAENFRAEFETITDADEVEAAFDEFIELHQYRWSKTGEPGVFAETAAREFHREAIRKLSTQNLVRLNFLKINGRRVVGSYNFVNGSEFSMYLLGMGNAGEAQRFSPGRLLSCYNIEQAITSGKTVLDFMRGVEEYKYQLLGVNAPNRTMTMYTQGGHAAIKAERNRNLNILFESSRSRVAKELTHLAATIKQNGALSRETLAYIAQRPGLLLHDARKKAREPLQPLYINQD